jgi:hypothetical protein
LSSLHPFCRASDVAQRHFDPMPSHLARAFKDSCATSGRLGCQWQSGWRTLACVISAQSPTRLGVAKNSSETVSFPNGARITGRRAQHAPEMGQPGALLLKACNRFVPAYTANPANRLGMTIAEDFDSQPCTSSPSGHASPTLQRSVSTPLRGEATSSAATPSAASPPRVLLEYLLTTPIIVHRFATPEICRQTATPGPLALAAPSFVPDSPPTASRRLRFQDFSPSK